MCVCWGGGGGVKFVLILPHQLSTILKKWKLLSCWVKKKYASIPGPSILTLRLHNYRYHCFFFCFFFHLTSSNLTGAKFHSEMFHDVLKSCIPPPLHTHTNEVAVFATKPFLPLTNQKVDWCSIQTERL